MTVRKTVEQKLQASILRRLEGREAIMRHPKRRAFRVYQYGHESLLVMAGLGLSHPVISALGGLPDSQSLPRNESAGFIAALLQYPPWVIVPCVFMIALWLALRIFVSVEKLADTVPLYNACCLELGKIESKLNEALSSSTPLKDLTPLQMEVTEIVNRYHEMGAWPWPVGPNDEDSRKQVIHRAKELCDQFENGWNPLPEVERKEE
jgi:hypothetical protein